MRAEKISENYKQFRFKSLMKISLPFHDYLHFHHGNEGFIRPRPYGFLMAELPSKFRDFLSNIRPSDRQISEYVNGHNQLRDRLTSDDDLSNIHVADFLQGSYARRTAVRPIGDEKSDVDIVFVTNLPKSKYAPSEAMELLEPFLDQYYGGQWKENQRSYKIELKRIEMDLVLTAAPSEAMMVELSATESIGQADVEALANQEDMGVIAKAIDATYEGGGSDWRDEPLEIPDREEDVWDETHPLATLEWTQYKNDQTNGNYINVVKAIKWWRRTHVDTPERPKSYPLERLVAECCPNHVSGVADGVTRTFDVFIDRYEQYAEQELTPPLGQHGLPEKNVLARVEGQNFAAFYDRITEAAEMAHRALDEENKEQSAVYWRDLFGEKFPLIGSPDADEKDDESTASFTPPSGTTNVSSQRFG